MKRGGFIEVNLTISISTFGQLLVKTQLKESIPHKKHLGNIYLNSWFMSMLEGHCHTIAYKLRSLG